MQIQIVLTLGKCSATFDDVSPLSWPAFSMDKSFASLFKTFIRHKNKEKKKTKKKQQVNDVKM